MQQIHSSNITNLKDSHPSPRYLPNQNNIVEQQSLQLNSTQCKLILIKFPRSAYHHCIVINLKTKLTCSDVATAPMTIPSTTTNRYSPFDRLYTPRDNVQQVHLSSTTTYHFKHVAPFPSKKENIVHQQSSAPAIPRTGKLMKPIRIIRPYHLRHQAMLTKKCNHTSVK